MSYISTPVSEVKVGDRVSFEVPHPKSPWQKLNRSAIVTKVYVHTDQVEIQLKGEMPKFYALKDRWGRPEEVMVKEVIQPSPFKVGQKVINRRGDLFTVIRVGDKTISTKTLEKDSRHSERSKEDPKEYVRFDSELLAQILKVEKEHAKLQRDIDRLEREQERVRKSISPAWKTALIATFGKDQVKEHDWAY